MIIGNVSYYFFGGIMKFCLFLFLGFLQGITEPLPISSSGHIFLLKRIFLLNFLKTFSFEIMLNFASFLAIFFIFWRDIVSLSKGFLFYLFYRDKRFVQEFQYILFLVIATIPVGIVGLFFKNLMENFLNAYPFCVGFGFLFTGILLFLLKENDEKKDSVMTIKVAFFIGLFQIFALFPGISRSGMTLIGGLFCGLTKESSLKFSFFLYFPVSIFTLLFSLRDVESFTSIFYLIPMIFAFLSTLFSYNYLKKLLLMGQLWKFSLYLFFIGVVSLLFLH